METDISVTLLTFVTITNIQATAITTLLNSNEWNRPGKPYTTEELLLEPHGYFLAISEGNIIGVARLKKVSWYQWEFFNLSIHHDFHRRGIGRKIVHEVEYFVASQKGGILQATIDPNNEGSKQLMKGSGWTQSLTFIHPYMDKPTDVWQKAVRSLSKKFLV